MTRTRNSSGASAHRAAHDMVPSKIVGFIALLLTNYYAAALVAECIGGNVDLDRCILSAAKGAKDSSLLSPASLVRKRRFYAAYAKMAACWSHGGPQRLGRRRSPSRVTVYP